MIHPCPHCGGPIFVLPSSQITSPAVAEEIRNLIAEGKEFREAMTDPDARASAGEFFETEILDEDAD